VNEAYESDLGQFETQHKFSSTNTVPAINVKTENGTLVRILRHKNREK
jgi:hypothetical protein